MASKTNCSTHKDPLVAKPILYLFDTQFYNVFYIQFSILSHIELYSRSRPTKALFTYLPDRPSLLFVLSSLSLSLLFLCPASSFFYICSLPLFSLRIVHLSILSLLFLLLQFTYLSLSPSCLSPFSLHLFSLSSPSVFSPILLSLHSFKNKKELRIMICQLYNII